MFTFLISWVAPLFLMTSPLTSYADQIRSIHVSKSSRGFSLDTPLIMLVASILRCFYWLGAEFETSLLVQSLIMIVVQITLLKVALDHRPPDAHHHIPFTTPLPNSIPSSITTVPPTEPRPYNFWQWRSQRPYWEFLLYFFLSCAALQLLLGTSPHFVVLQGYLALGIEALLPIPQVVQNQRTKSCRGFRLSVLASWILGDVMKQIFFFTAEHIQIQFKLCAIFQFAMDLFMCWQFYTFGEGNNDVLQGEKMQTVAEKMEMLGMGGSLEGNGRMGR